MSIVQKLQYPWIRLMLVIKFSMQLKDDLETVVDKPFLELGR